MNIVNKIKIKNIPSFIKLIIIKFIYWKKINIIGVSHYFGKNVKLIIGSGGKIIINDRTYFSDYSYFESINGKIVIGNHTFFNRFCNIVSREKIVIGDNCIFGNNVSIYDHNHVFENTNKPIRDSGFSSKEIVIGNDVWVSSNCFITAGVKIGNHVVIGANSVVTHDLVSNGVYCGNPAKLIKKL